MRSSVFWKVFGGYLLVALVVVTALLTFALRTIRHYHIATLRNDLRSQAVVLDELTRDLVLEGRSVELQTMVKDMAGKTGARVTVIDTAGRVLADSDEDPELMENHSARPEIMAAYRGDTGSSVRYSRTVKQEMLYVAIPVQDQGRIVAVMRVSLFLSDVNALLARLGREVLVVSGVLVLLSLVAALGFARWLSRPLTQLVHASRRVGSGDFDARVAAAGRDELGELGESFNDMVARLKELVASQTRQREALGIIINSMDEGLLVLDKDGKVRLANDSFLRMVGEEAVAGRQYWEVIREPGLGELVKRAGEAGRVGGAEIEFRGRRYSCSVGFVPASEQTVVTFHDITEMAKMARMKRDLVVNVSHELRTPLTAIKGFVETMEETESDENRRYLKIIGRHTERLINIVKDLLTLSELEEKGIELQTRPVDLGGLVENVLKTFEKRVAEKGLKLSLEGGPEVGKVEADAFKLEQVFINLIDNSVKYTDKGEIKVKLSRHNGQVKVEVSDTGIGIPKEQLSRVFERFFVTDKARSRKLGGTGLGLSIVKHIVLLHGGEIRVDSGAGKGTVFTIFLPAAD